MMFVYVPMRWIVFVCDVTTHNAFDYGCILYESLLLARAHEFRRFCFIE